MWSGLHNKLVISFDTVHGKKRKNGQRVLFETAKLIPDMYGDENFSWVQIFCPSFIIQSSCEDLEGNEKPGCPILVCKKVIKKCMIG